MLNQMYEQYCANRLPCGICRLTSSQCLKASCGITINWAEATYTSQKTTPCTFTNTTGTTVDAKNIYTGTTEAHLS